MAPYLIAFLTLVAALLIALVVQSARVYRLRTRLDETLRGMNELINAKAAQLAQDMVERAREDAVRRSQSVIAGKVYEQLVPLLPWFRYNPKDARFLGSPVDLIVFDGLDEGQLRAVRFIEVKKGSSKLTEREKMVKDAIESCKVAFEVIQI